MSDTGTTDIKKKALKFAVAIHEDGDSAMQLVADAAIIESYLSGDAAAASAGDGSAPSDGGSANGSTASQDASTAPADAATASDSSQPSQSTADASQASLDASAPAAA